MKSQLNLDKVGAFASAICAVHCLLTGVALGLLSIIGLGFIGSPAAEFGFIGVAVVVGIWAIVHGIRKHHSYVPSLIFVMGLTFIALSHFVFPHRHGGEALRAGGGQVLSTFFSILGGLSLVAFHVVNLRLQRKCSCKHCAHNE